MNNLELLYEIAQTPTEGRLFEVKPLEIDRSSFEMPQQDKSQNELCNLIQKAFAEVDKHLEKYASPFFTLVPEKDWDEEKSVAELKAYANACGGEMADWVEQALEWAQRISNGESWEDICNNEDTLKWFRMIVWKNGDCRLVGCLSFNNPASNICGWDYDSDGWTYFAVPLIVFKK